MMVKQTYMWYENGKTYVKQVEKDELDRVYMRMMVRQNKNGMDKRNTR